MNIVKPSKYISALLLLTPVLALANQDAKTYQYAAKSAMHKPYNLLANSPGATLGFGFSHDLDQPLTMCLNAGTVTYGGSAEGLIDVLRNYSLEEVKQQLNISLDGDIDFGFFSADGSTKFVHDLETDDYSESLIYRSWIRLKNTIYNPTGAGTDALSPVGKSIFNMNDPDLFRHVCGDQYYAQMEWGGYLYAAVKFHFVNSDDKKTFDESFGGDFDIGSVSEKLSYAVEKINKQGSITVTAFQVGGDPDQLGRILGGSGGTAPVITCSFDNMAQCQQLLNNIITYASSPTGNNFPTQIQIGSSTTPTSAAQTGQQLLDYIYLGITSKAASVITPEIIAARRQLASVLTQITTDTDRAKFLMSRSTDSNYRAKLQDLIDSLNNNYDIINSAGQACFTDNDLISIKDCPANAQKAINNQKEIDRKLLEDPIDADISMRLTSSSGNPILIPNRKGEFNINLVTGAITRLDPRGSVAQSFSISKVLGVAPACDNTTVTLEAISNNFTIPSTIKQMPNCSNGYNLVVDVPVDFFVPAITNIQIHVTHFDQ